MKFLLLLVVALLVVWVWRSGRRSDEELPRQEEHPTTPPGPQTMVRCAHCGVHLPQADAVVGRVGLYCSAEHRQRAEP